MSIKKDPLELMDSLAFPGALAEPLMVQPEGGENDEESADELSPPPEHPPQAANFPLVRQLSQETHECQQYMDGRGRGRKGPVDRTPSVLLSKPRRPFERKKHFPFFILLISAVDLVMFLVTLIFGPGFESPKRNPMIGPSQEALVKLGAKDTEKIKDGQFWRLFTPIFLHVGIVHLAINLSSQLFMGMIRWGLERGHGAFRIAPIYFLSGIMGNIFSCIFLPDMISVGASGALFGFIGILFVDLIQNWRVLKRPKLTLVRLLRQAVLTITTIITFAIGMMPYVDNFAHLGGFLEGLITAFIFLPPVHYAGLFGTKKKRRIAVVVAIIVCLFSFGILLWVFYAGISTEGWCKPCLYFGCVPIVKSWECGRVDSDDSNSTATNSTRLFLEDEFLY